MSITHTPPAPLHGDQNPAVLAAVAGVLAEEAARGRLDLADVDDRCAIVGLISRRLAVKDWILDCPAARDALAAAAEYDQRAVWLMDTPAARRHAAAVIARHATPRMQLLDDATIAGLLEEAAPLNPALAAMGATVRPLVAEVVTDPAAIRALMDDDVEAEPGPEVRERTLRDDLARYVGRVLDPIAAAVMIEDYRAAVLELGARERLAAVAAVLDRLETDADCGRLAAAGAWVVQQIRAAAEGGEPR